MQLAGLQGGAATGQGKPSYFELGCCAACAHRAKQLHMTHEQRSCLVLLPPSPRFLPANKPLPPTHPPTTYLVLRDERAHPRQRCYERHEGNGTRQRRQLLQKPPPRYLHRVGLQHGCQGSPRVGGAAGASPRRAWPVAHAGVVPGLWRLESADLWSSLASPQLVRRGGLLLLLAVRRRPACACEGGGPSAPCGLVAGWRGEWEEP